MPNKEVSQSSQEDPVIRAKVLLRQLARVTDELKAVLNAPEKATAAPLCRRLIRRLNDAERSLTASLEQSSDAPTSSAQLSLIEAEDVVREAEESLSVIDGKKSLFVSASTLIVAASVTASALVTILTVWSSIAKADADAVKAQADAKIAASSAETRAAPKLALSWVDSAVGEPLGTYLITATLDLKSLGADPIYVTKLDFFAYLAELNESGLARDDAGVSFSAMPMPIASKQDRDASKELLPWRQLETRSFPDPPGCWLVEAPRSHVADGFAEQYCNPNGAGVYEDGESLIASRRWRLALSKRSEFAVRVVVTWTRPNKKDATPWEFTTSAILGGAP